MESIVVIRDYGDITFDIKSIMDKKKITVSQVVKKTGLHHKVVRRYYEGNVTRYDKDVLAKFCFILQCEIADIKKYKKPEKWLNDVFYKKLRGKSKDELLF